MQMINETRDMFRVSFFYGAGKKYLCIAIQ